MTKFIKAVHGNVVAGGKYFVEGNPVQVDDSEAAGIEIVNMIDKGYLTSFNTLQAAHQHKFTTLAERARTDPGLTRGFVSPTTPLKSDVVKPVPVSVPVVPVPVSVPETTAVEEANTEATVVSEQKETETPVVEEVRVDVKANTAKQTSGSSASK